MNKEEIIAKMEEAYLNGSNIVVLFSESGERITISTEVIPEFVEFIRKGS
jgi:hypothetical protein